MKKKYITIILSAVFVLGMTSCNDWLDVEQNTERQANKMFDNYDGFKGALAGCYSDLVKTDLYGTRLTMSNVDAMACLWYMDETKTYKSSILDNFYFRIHDYTNTNSEASIRAIYSAFYNTILEANMVIKGAQEKGNNIENPKSRALVEGEAYAIRALCQFDILRLFGQVPVNPTILVSLPYSEVTSLDEEAVYYPFDQYVEKLKADLEKAKALMKDNDPVFDYTYKELNMAGTKDYEHVSVEDEFFLSRQYRMNYWAVRALEARMYMYLGQKQLAHDIAMEVINAKTKNDKKVVELSSYADYGTGDLSLYSSPSECLFCLYMSKLRDVSTGILCGGDAQGENIMRVDPEYHLVLSETWLTNLFAGCNTATDIRFLKMWSKTATVSGFVWPTIRKYYSKEAKDNSGVTPLCEIPVIRLSEMYLIAMEGASSLEEANTLYATYMESKGVSRRNYFDSMDKVKAELPNEYRREFFAEGQMFYYYKRNKSARMWSKENVEVRESEYILPLPNTEYNPNK